MKTAITLLLIGLMTSATAYAESYLCLADASTGIRSANGKVLGTTQMDIEEQRFLLSDNNGELSLKIFGTEPPLLDKCKSEYFCEYSDGYRGTFTRQTNNFFTIFFTVIVSNERIAVVSQGKCSTI
ncbi:hypothetical protein [Amphritea sp. HPY]|uniref:hypothetical protein n=1 Tax=Amphritea sp. HPY TaxID=3421652 RepID=UPI003D7D309A